MSETANVDVVLVDDHPLLAAGLRVRLAERAVTLEVAPVLEAEAIERFVLEHDPRLVLLDYVIPPLGVSTGLIAPFVRSGRMVLILTGTNDPALWGQFLSLGATAVLGKDEPLDTIIDAVCDVLDGRAIRTAQSFEFRDTWQRSQAEARLRLAPFVGLSAWEAAVLWALYEGRSPAQIASADFVSIDTVRSQMKSAFRKLGVSSQLEAVTMVRQTGWTPTP